MLTLIYLYDKINPNSIGHFFPLDYAIQIEFVTKLINDAGVAAVPGRGFFHKTYDGESYSHRYVRFAFCKGDDTLKAAAMKMRKLASRPGEPWLTGREDQTMLASN